MLLKLPLAALCLCLALAGSAAAAPETFDTARFDAEMTREMARLKVPGAAVLIIKDGKTVVLKGYGTRGAADKTPVTENTIFALGSCTKAFTAMAVVMLDHCGSLGIDEPVTKVIPDFKAATPALTAGLTPRDILAQRTGLSDHDAIMALDDKTRARAAARIQYIEPNCRIREKFQYCNMHYLLAGYLVDRASGVKCEDYIVSKILEPLEIKAFAFGPAAVKKFPDYAFPTKIDTSALPDGSAQDAETLLKQPAADIPFADIGVYTPAGGLSMSVRDYEKWIRVFMDCSGKEFSLPALRVEDMITTQSPAMKPYSPKNPSSVSGYGLGWGSGVYKGRFIASHDGQIDGFSAHALVMPGEKCAIAILNNSDSGGILNSIMSIKAQDLLFGEDSSRETDKINCLVDEAARKEHERLRELRSRESKTHYPSDLKPFTGVYDNAGYYPVKISGGKERLEFEVQGSARPFGIPRKGELRYSGTDSFFTVEKGAVTEFQFGARGKNGLYEGLTINYGGDGGRRVVFIRQL
jgi:CubicO group peptidase (beta-lactamase class C family)